MPAQNVDLRLNVVITGLRAGYPLQLGTGCIDICDHPGFSSLGNTSSALHHPPQTCKRSLFLPPPAHLGLQMY